MTTRMRSQGRSQRTHGLGPGSLLLTLWLVSCVAAASAPVAWSQANAPLRTWERDFDPTTGADPRNDYLPGQIVVRFQSGTIEPPAKAKQTRPFTVNMPPQVQELLDQAGVQEMQPVFSTFDPGDTMQTLPGGEVVHLPDLSQAYVLTFDPNADVRVVVQQFAQSPEVIYAEPHYRVHAVIVPGDPLFGSQWSLESSEDIDAVAAWDLENGDHSVKIGIVDTGIDHGHPDLGSGFGSTSKVVAGFNAFSPGGSTSDDYFHGTHVAGIAAALTNNSKDGAIVGIAGIAGGWGYDWNTNTGDKGAALVALKALDAGGSGGTSTVSDCIVAAASSTGQPFNDCRVINLSLGSYSENLTIADAVYFATTMGRVVVAAKGNDNTTAAHYPSDYDGAWVLSVGATNQSGSRATPADWGGTKGSNYGNHIDVVAPGTTILSTLPTYRTPAMDANGIPSNYGTLNGTSMATPHVSGLAALMLAANNSLRPDDVQGIITLSADDKQAAGYDQETGYGRINARRALELCRAPYTKFDYSASGGVDVGQTGLYLAKFLKVGGSLNGGTYQVRRHEVRKTVSVPATLTGPAYAWGRSVGSGGVGWSYANLNFETPYCDVVPRLPTSSAIELRTYVYEVWVVGGRFLGWYPTTPGGVVFKYTVLGIPPPVSVAIDGPVAVQPGNGCTWTTVVSGGDGNYAYEWRWRNTVDQPWSAIAGTGPTFTRTFANVDIQVQVRVTSLGLEGYATRCTPSAATFPAPSVTIVGPTVLDVGQTGTWLSNLTGGWTCGAYTREWQYRYAGEANWSPTVGTGYSYSQVSDGREFELRAWGYAANANYDLHYVAVPPAQVSDLLAEWISPHSIVVTWTAPAIHGGNGVGTEYDLRFSPVAITDENTWGIAASVVPQPVPEPTGNGQYYEIAGLNSCTRYYFAIKTKDDLGSWSRMSNVTNGRTLCCCGPMAGAGTDADTKLATTVEVPAEFALHANRPNPFDQSTIIGFDLPRAGIVRLEIFDAQGRRVRLLRSGFESAGRWTEEWNRLDDHGNRVGPGVYLYRVAAGEFRAQRRLVVLP